MIDSPVDAMVGQRIRALRLARGLSQNELGALIGASVDEMELFETGARRVGAGRIMRIARALRVEVGAFFGNSFAFAEPSGSPDMFEWLLGRVGYQPSRTIH